MGGTAVTELLYNGFVMAKIFLCTDLGSVLRARRFLINGFVLLVRFWRTMFC